MLLTIVGVNGAYALKDRLDFQLYIIVDMSFSDRCTDVVQVIITNPTLTLFTTLHDIAQIIDQFTLAAARCQLALIENACYHIYQPGYQATVIGRHFGQEPHISSVMTIMISPLPSIDIRSSIFDAGIVVFGVP